MIFQVVTDVEFQAMAALGVLLPGVTFFYLFPFKC